jgi:hypothetical protein
MQNPFSHAKVKAMTAMTSDSVSLSTPSLLAATRLPPQILSLKF